MEIAWLIQLNDLFKYSHETTPFTCFLSVSHTHTHIHVSHVLSHTHTHTHIYTRVHTLIPKNSKYNVFIISELFEVETVNKNTCSLKTQKLVDREVKSRYTLTIHVNYNNLTRQKRAGNENEMNKGLI